MSYASCCKSQHAAASTGSSTAVGTRRHAAIVSFTVLMAMMAMGDSHASAKIVVPPPVSKRNLRRSLQVGVHK
jgi:hypothetical protein